MKPLLQSTYPGYPINTNQVCLPEFNGSQTSTLGVEIELQILDPDTNDLIPQAEKILKACHENGLKRIKAEIHQSMLEIDSEISYNVKECSNFLKQRIIALKQIAQSLNLKIATSGTHPFQRWADRLISNQNRYLELHQKFQWLVRRMNVYGMHVHIGVSSGDRALEIAKRMICYLPHLLALSANSPFWQGVDTGMQSSRISVIETFPFAGLPPAIYSWKELEHYYASLHRVGVISSLKDLYWYIRPNPTFGTIEFRICDAMSSFSETMAVVAFIHCLVVWVNEQIESQKIAQWSIEQHWIAPENQWIAARDGLEGRIIVNTEGEREKISNSILQLINLLSPIAEILNCKEELFYLTTILHQGNGAQRQRDIYAKTGCLKTVVDYCSQQF